MTDSLCRKRKLAGSFIPCGHCRWLERLGYGAEGHGIESQPRGYKTFFVLNSAEHEILNANKYKNVKNFSFFSAQISRE